MMKKKLKRKQYKNGYINIFAGRSEPYQGDRYLSEHPDNKDYILLEIHMFDIIDDNNIEKNAIFYGLYIPGKGVIQYVGID